METTVITLYIIAAFLSAAGMLFLTLNGFTRKKLGLIHVAVSLWTGIITLNHFLPLFSSKYTLFADWVITTPLLVLALGETVASTTELGDKISIYFATVLQALVIIAGYFSLVNNSILYFVFGMIFMAGVFSMVLRTAKTPVHKMITAGFFAFWLLYPAIFMLGMLGSVLTPAQTAISIYVVAFFSKQVFGFLDILFLDKL